MSAALLPRLTGALAGMATVLALGLAAPAEAKPGHCPPGQAKKGNCSQSVGPAHADKAKGHGGPTRAQRKAAPRHEADHRRPAPRVVAPAAAAATAAAAAAATPVVVDRLRDDGRVVVGQPLGISRYHRIADPVLFGLPVRNDGLGYYLAGDRIVRADPRDWRVREVVGPFDRARFCPPGLAKKEPACIPPGQVNKIMRTEWDADRFIPIRDYGRYGLAAPGDGWGYYVLDNAIVRVDDRTHEVLSLVRLIDAIL